MSYYTQGTMKPGVSKVFGSNAFTAVPEGDEARIVAVFGFCGAKDEAESIANTKRFCAVWNSCEGISTDDLERYRDRPSDLSLIALKAVRKHDELQQQVDQFRALAAANAKALGSALAQRDELLAALDGLLNALPSATSHPAIKAAKAARANAMKDEK